MILSAGEQKFYNSGNYPERIEDGIKRFSVFDARLRYQAQMALREGVETLIGKLTLTREQKDSMTIEDIKKYADLLKVMLKEMPESIRSIETINLGFQTRSTTRAQKDADTNFVAMAMAGIEQSRN